jgi:hypothetical protein
VFCQQTHEFREFCQLLDLGDVAEIAGQDRGEIRTRPVLTPPFAVTADRFGVAAAQNELDQIVTDDRIFVAL